MMAELIDDRQDEAHPPRIGDQSEFAGAHAADIKQPVDRLPPDQRRLVRAEIDSDPNSPFNSPKDGRPEGYYENFATGFRVSGE
jgi:hypothetical protein